MVIAGGAILYSGISGITDNRQKLIAPNEVIEIEIVDTPELRKKGLSGRQQLENKKGMLFKYDEPSLRNCIWMKDMNFSLDIIWLNDKKEVTDVKKDVSPETFSESFCPKGETQYVLEVNSGNADSFGISEGVVLKF